MKEIVEVGLIKDSNLVRVPLTLTELANDLLRIDLAYKEFSFYSEAYTYFEALISIRHQLEENNYQIVCKGACENVYTSAMILNMGEGRKAYELFMGRQAKFDDLVDIFEFDETMKCVSVRDQKAYYDLWWNSLLGD